MANFFDQFDTGVADAQTPKGNFFDQFDAPGPVSPQPAPVIPAVGPSTSPAAQPPKMGNYFDQFDAPAQPEVAQSAPKPAKNAGFFSGAGSGFMSGLLSQNPDLASEALEAWSHLGPEGLRDPLLSASRGMRNLKSDDYQTSEIRLRDVTSRPELFTWLGEAIGQGVASSLPSVATGAAGAGLGAAVAGPPGAVAGGLAGAVTSSLPFNQAEVYKELKQHGIDPRVAAEHSLYAAVPMAALDVYSVGKLAQQFGMGEIKKQAARVLARRIAEETAKGATREGATEAAQEVIKKIAVDLSADVPFWSKDNMWDIVESGAAGFATGGAMGAPAGIRRDPVPSVAPTDQQIEAVHSEISGAKVQSAPSAPVAKEESAPQLGRAPSEAMAGPSAPSLASEPTPPAPVFYSQVERIAREKLPETFTSEQLLGTLQNAPGVKPEELEWLRVPEFAKRDGKISKTDLLAHLEDNVIAVEDVTYQSGNTVQSTLVNVPAESDREVQGWTVAEAPGWRISEEPADQGSSFTLYNPQGQVVRESATLEEAQGALNRVLQPPNETQYSGWQALKGGENYREHLLRMETPTPPGVSEDVELNDYVSPHWEPTNVVAHYRTSQFTDVTGKRGLAVQEIQSDWHQSGRKQGYQNDPLPFVPKVTSVKQLRSGPGQFDNIWRIVYENGWERETSGVRTEQEAQTRGQSLIENEILKIGRRVPEAPFKSNWAELAVKRILRQAADEGHERVYFTPGKLHAELYRQSGEQESGQVEFYDKILPRIVEKWTKKLGGKTGRTEIVTSDGNRESVFYVDLNPQMASTIQRGLPMFSQVYALPQLMKSATKDGFVPPVAPGMDATGTVDLTPIVEATAKIVKSIANQLGMQAPVFVRIGNAAEANHHLGMYNPWNYPDGDFAAHVITVYPSMMTSESQVYATIAHELGHAIQREKFDRADAMTQLLVLEEYHKYREEIGRSQVDTMAGIFARRDNFLMQDKRDLGTMVFDPRRLSPERREYWLGFEEWFAENVARWMTTDEKALTKVEKLFASIARAIRKMYAVFQARTGMTADVNEQIKGFLEALEHQQLNVTGVVETTKVKTEKKNAAALRAAGLPDGDTAEYTVTTASSRNLISGLASASMMGLPTQQQGLATAAMVDHFSKWYKWGLSVIQLAERNPHIHSLFRYKELWQQKTLERQTIMDEALVTVKAWKELNQEQSDNVAGLIDDYMNMRYLTPQEVAAGITRLPTQNELITLVRNNKVDTRGLALFQQIQQNFQNMMTRYEAVLTADAMKIADPTRRAAKLRSVQQQFVALAKQPYFPAMRFGDLTLEVRDAADQLVEFYTFESNNSRGKAEAKLRAKYPQSAGYTIKRNKLDESSGPLIGVPPGLLDLIEDKLSLNQAQRNDLELLRFELAPGHSFKHRFERKNRVPGYSMDFRRAFANYFFHGSNHLTRVKYIDEMRQVVSDLRDESRAMLDGEKRKRIADFVDDHLNYMMNPTSDWSTLRAITFLFALGFSPAAALINTTQMLIGSYPVLSAGFGDVQTIAAMTKAGAQLSSYYKRPTIAAKGRPIGPNLTHTEFEMTAIGEAVKEGVITEAMAPELAALSEGNNLHGSVGGKAKQAWMKFMEMGGFMFEMTEQWNRRVTFRAALNLALEQPNAQFVRDAITKNPDQYDRLRQGGWSARQAGAFTTAKYAVETTQYIYGQYAQPRLMRGKLRTVFIFKSFLQNTLFMLWNNPSAAIRSVLVMGALGGLMGLPGMDDLMGLIKLIGKRIFGENWDLNEDIRKFAIDHLGGVVPPDLILHGTSRYGFGLPAVMDAVGVPMPKLDMSTNISMGNILPVELDKMFAGGQNPERAMLDTAQRASGASFGMFFNMWRAINDTQQDTLSLQRWMKAMPREAQALSKAYQAFATGAIPDRAGAPVVKFDPNDTRHMMEIMAMAGGWQPTRLRAQWDLKIAQKEAELFWDERRNGLLRQFWSAHKAGNNADLDIVRSSIVRFNSQLPDEAKGKAITRDTLSRSLQTRSRVEALKEQGLPAQKSNVGIYREIQRLHPEADVNVRPVR